MFRLPQQLLNDTQSQTKHLQFNCSAKGIIYLQQQQQQQQQQQRLVLLSQKLRKV